jgi:hypothetical protein
MWRAFFIGLGVVLIIVGAEFLAIDSAILSGGAPQEVARPRNFFFGGQVTPVETQRTFRPSEWMPWSLLASGAVIMLYAKTIRRAAGSPG